MTAPAAPTVCASDEPLLLEQAKKHFACNLAALGRSLAFPPIEPVLGRDGSLTAKRDGAWLAGCSVPRRAAELMLRSLAVRGNLACLPVPTHAHQIAVCLERMDRYTGLIVLVEHEDALAEMLACVDFSAPLAAGQLFFAIGPEELRELFTRQPGLPVPQQFVRVSAAAGEACDAIMRSAQGIFSDIAQRQQDRLARVQSRPPAVGSNQPAVLAPSGFRLWNDAGVVLAAHVPGAVIDPDDPRQSAVAHIAEVAATHPALVTVDLARADRPELLPADRPWITWITQARVPAFVPGSPRDGLILCDNALRPLATRAGWPTHRVAVAPVPTLPIGQSPADTTSDRPDKAAAMIIDLPALTPPPAVNDFSSWRLVWEAIEHELLENPTRLGPDAGAYLDRLLARYNIADRNVPKPLFLDGLIAPAYAIGIAKLLAREGVPIALYGSGWNRIASLARFARGPVMTRDRFTQAVRESAALIDVFVTAAVHPVRTLGLPIVRTVGATASRIVQDARSVLAHPPAPAASPAPTLAQALESLLA